jgi:hypothetical protein
VGQLSVLDPILLHVPVSEETGGRKHKPPLPIGRLAEALRELERDYDLGSGGQLPKREALYER